MTKEEILQEFSDINHVYNNCTRYDTLRRMLNELTEPKTGRWIYIKNSEVNGLKIVKCSECGKRTYGSGKYCPNCGCKMESEDKE